MSTVNILQAFSSKPMPMEFTFDGFLHGTVGSIVSPGGSGKSMYALQLATQLAAGTTVSDLLGVQLDKKRLVSYLPAEDPEIVIRHRLHAIGKHYEPHEQRAISESLMVYPVIGKMPNIMDEEWFGFLDQVAEASELIILDTLRRWHLADENDASAMAKVLSRLEYLADQYECSILFLHHTSKATALGGMGDAQQASRGSSVLTDNVRWQMNLVKMTEQEAKKYGISPDRRGFYVKSVVSKSNYGKPAPERWYERIEGGVLKRVVLEAVKGGVGYDKASVIE